MGTIAGYPAHGHTLHRDSREGTPEGGSGQDVADHGRDDRAVALDPAIIRSCENGPALYLRSKRVAPTAFSVAAILRATVSGDPTYSEPCSISCS